MNQIALVLTFCILYVQAASSKSPPRPSTAKPPIKADASTTPSEVEFEFSDINGLMCLLCARQFKSTDQLKRHNKESDLHKARNLQCCILSHIHGLTLPFVLPYTVDAIRWFLCYRRTSRMPIYEILRDKKLLLGRQVFWTSLNIGIVPQNGEFYSTNPTLLFQRKRQIRTRSSQKNPLVPFRRLPLHHHLSILARMLPTWVIRCLK